MRIAAIAARENPTLPPIDELIDMARSRRRFIRDASLATAGLVITGCSKPAPAPAQQQSGGTPSPAPAPSNPRGGVRIAIVGAGMAGLNTAYKLQKAGLTAKIFEGADRTGGRMFTRANLLGEGFTTELGGEFIDSNHAEMLALMEEFGFDKDKIDVRSKEAASLKPETYFINSEGVIVDKYVGPIPPDKMQEHLKALGI